MIDTHAYRPAARRALPGAIFGLCFAASSAMAETARETWWDDLVPEGVPQAEIVGDGEKDRAADTWKPEYDENATRFNEALDGALVKMPGFIIPMGGGVEGVSSFLLVPYVGACIHVPPPPANQVVFVETETPWPNDNLWDPVWVTGILKIQMMSTELADVGYTLGALSMEPYEEE